MVKIKVGEYVRLKNGEIFKIDENTTNYYNSNKDYITNEITSHSKNIIDLIKIGDYVNGFRVTNFVLNDGNKIGITVDSDFWAFDADEIKTIVTYEQFKIIEYKVEE